MTRIGIVVAPQRSGGAPLQRSAEPVTMGLPLPRGLCVNTREIGLVDATGVERPVQIRTLNRWPDGSIKWALVDLQADIEGAAGRSRYELVVGRAPRGAAAGPRVTASTSGTAVTVDTGAARFSIRPGDGFPCAEITIDGQPVVDPKRTALLIEDADGQCLTTVIDRVEVEDSGPLRAVVRCEGRIVGPRAKVSLQLIARLHFFAGSATVRIVLTLRNPRAAGHSGGHWTLGERGSVFLRDASLRIALADVAAALSARCSPEHGARYAAYDLPFELYQDSSGGEAWNSAVHKNREHVVPNQMRGYRLRAGASETTALRACPVLSVSTDTRTLSAAMPYFWQNFPKAFEADGDSITCRLFPRQYADAHEVQG